MKILLSVQGEGNGHLSQAIAFKEIVSNISGYEICGIIINNKNFPEYIYEYFNNVHVIESLNFKKNKSGSVNIFNTILYNTFHINKYFKSLKKYDKTIKEYQPDLIMNFYDFNAGLYNLFYNNKIPVISVGHQYLIHHNKYQFPDNNIFSQFFFKLANKITSYKSIDKWALSYYSLNNEKNLKVIPPLIKHDIRELKPHRTKKEYLVYSDYIKKKISKIASQYPFHTFHVFNNNKNQNDENNVILYNISRDKFLEKLRDCEGIITSAGFDMIAEALYLNKYIMVVPVKNQYEQKCNAYEIHKNNIGVWCKNFNFNYYLHNKNDIKNNYKKWFDQTPIMVMQLLKSIKNQFE